MQRCPICRARLRGANICPRCGADLTVAQRTSQSARIHQAKAFALLADGKYQQAKKFFIQANRLKKDELMPYLSRFIGDVQISSKGSNTTNDRGAR